MRYNNDPMNPDVEPTGGKTGAAPEVAPETPATERPSSSKTGNAQRGIPVFFFLVARRAFVLFLARSVSTATVAIYCSCSFLLSRLVLPVFLSKVSTVKVNGAGGFFAMPNTISLFNHDRTLHHQIRPGDEPEEARESSARIRGHPPTRTCTR
jgi:hypothetical protein